MAYQNLNNQSLDFFDILTVLSFMIDLQNLKENKTQSEHDAIQKANHAQSHELLKEIRNLFSEQNEMLIEILEKLS